MSLLKESGYSRVLINSANKYFLQKNEDEFLSNLYDVDPSRGEHLKDVQNLDQFFAKKLNVLTSKIRPFCDFCNALCGFNWYVSLEEKPVEICRKCFEKGQYPSHLSKNSFAQKSLALDQWERISKNIKESSKFHEPGANSTSRGD